MTYKAGDKVWYMDAIGTVDGFNGKEYWIKEMYQYISPSFLIPATPVEIAKQAVLDEVSSIANNSTELISNLLDQLISEVKIATLNITKETFERSLNNNLNQSPTPPIIGDETKLD